MTRGGKFRVDVVSLAGEASELPVGQVVDNRLRRGAQERGRLLAVDHQRRRLDSGEQPGRQGQTASDRGVVGEVVSRPDLPATCGCAAGQSALTQGQRFNPWPLARIQRLRGTTEWTGTTYQPRAGPLCLASRRVFYVSGEDDPWPEVPARSAPRAIGVSDECQRARPRAPMENL